MERVCELEMLIIKLAKVAKLNAPKDSDARLADDGELGVVTADVEVEPLVRATLEAVRDLDLVLQSLAMIDKPKKLTMIEDIQQLKRDLKEKEGLMSEAEHFIKGLETHLAEN